MKQRFLVFVALLLMCFAIKSRLWAQTSPPGQFSSHFRTPSTPPPTKEDTLNATLASGEQVPVKVNAALLNEVDRKLHIALNAKTALTLKGLVGSGDDQPLNVKASDDSVHAKKKSLAAATCVKGTDKTGNTIYSYRPWFPLNSSDCDAEKGAAYLYFFNVEKTTVLGNQVQYLYNGKQSTNAVNADLYSGTFGFFQIVLAGTTTAGSSQASPVSPSSGSGVTAPVYFLTTALSKLESGKATAHTAQSSSSSGTTTQTDSVTTAVSKLEQGGDFNVRLNVPLFWKPATRFNSEVGFLPNVGFTVNGVTAQSTITQSTQYSVNLPIEGNFAYDSIDSQTDGTPNATIYGNVKVGGEIISPALQTAIGVPNRVFLLTQLALGVQFMKSIRVGVQYFIGPKQFYTTTSSTGSSTQVSSGLGGFHLVVSFNPQAPKSSGS